MSQSYGSVEVLVVFIVVLAEQVMSSRWQLPQDGHVWITFR